MRYFHLTPLLAGPGAARYPIGDQPLLIGRSERADIALLEPTVSRRHATVQCQNERVLLKDLGSKHGTFVNSKRVTSATLKVGDIVVFGLSMVLRLESTDEPISPVASGWSDSTQTPELLADDGPITAIRTVTIPPSPRTGSSAETREDIGRIQNQMAKVHKLAGAGAACIQHLPELASKLATARDKIAAMTSTRPELSEALSAVEEVVIGLQRLNQNLSLLPRRRLEPTVLAEVVESAVRDAAADAVTRKVRISTEVANDLLTPAESPRLTHAVSEVLRNAIRHSPEQSTVQVIGNRRGTEITLSVIDSGTGFPPEILESACDPFVTRTGQWEALGLGLFEARQIVMSCGGSLQIISRPGLTTVRVVLPAVS